MAEIAEEDERHPGFASWRQFHGLCLDLPAPDAGEIDARLRIYRRAHEVGALRDFGAALLLVAAIGRALLEGSRVFTAMSTVADGLVFGLTCTLLVVIGLQALQRLHRATEQRALVRAVGLDSLPWQKAESLLADARGPAVRDYLQSVREHARPLRRAEAAAVIERAKGRPPLDDAGPEGFARHIRDRKGTLGRQLVSACACLIAVLMPATGTVDGAVFMPILILFGGWSLAGLLGGLLQLLLDPWELRGGGPACARIRAAVAGDLVPEAAVLLILVATSVRVLAAG